MPSFRVPDAIRRIVAARARDYCEYCRCPGRFATESFTVEHTKPRIAGGETTLENLAWSCFGCNSHKHTKTYGIDPETGQQETLYNPRQLHLTELPAEIQVAPSILKMMWHERNHHNLAQKWLRSCLIEICENL